MAINMGEVAVGMQVGYYRGTNHGWSDIGIATVVKIGKGTGHVTLDNGLVFDKHGDEYGKGHYGRRLVDVPALQQMQALQQAQDNTNNAMRNAEDGLARILRNHRAGTGNYGAITAEEKAQLFALIEALPVKPPEGCPPCPV